MARATRSDDANDITVEDLVAEGRRWVRAELRGRGLSRSVPVGAGRRAREVAEAAARALLRADADAAGEDRAP